MRTWTSDLWPDDQAIIMKLIDTQMAKGDGNNRNDARKVAEILLENVEWYCEEGEKRRLCALVADGLYALVRSRRRDLVAPFALPGLGQVMLPLYISVKRRRVDEETGRKRIAIQSCFWPRLAWKEFAAAVAEQANQSARFAYRVSGYQAALRLREIYPSSQTPEEALKSDGQDVAAVVADLQ